MASSEIRHLEAFIPVFSFTVVVVAVLPVTLWEIQVPVFLLCQG